MACEDEPARRLGVERGDDVVEGDPLAEDGVLRVRHHVHLPLQRTHLLRYVLKRMNEGRSISVYRRITSDFGLVDVQGDTSRSSKHPVDIDLKVVF